MQESHKTKHRKVFEKSFTTRENCSKTDLQKQSIPRKIPFMFVSIGGTVQRKESISIPLETTAAIRWKENSTGKLGHSSRQFSPQGRSKIRRGGENPSPFDALSAMRIRHDHGSALDAATRFRNHVYHANY